MDSAGQREGCSLATLLALTCGVTTTAQRKCRLVQVAANPTALSVTQGARLVTVSLLEVGA